MSDLFDKINQLNLIVSVEDVFDYIGAAQEKEDPFKTVYSCPYHSDDLPSLLVDKESGKFNCFACDCGGYGAYSCAKYYLQFTNNSKPTLMMVVNFLCEIKPEIEQFKYLFAGRARREYEYGQDKRRDFSNRIKGANHMPALAVAKRRMTNEQIGIYIDAIMTGMPDEFILQAVGVKNKKISSEGSKEFLSLLGD